MCFWALTIDSRSSTRYHYRKLYNRLHTSFGAVEQMKVSNDKDLGRLVRSLRERLQLSQERLAARLGVTFTTVNRWENEHAKPSPLAMRQIEELVGELGNDGQDLWEEYFGG